MNDTAKQLLIVDDDAPLRNRLARAMERKGFAVMTAESVKDAISSAEKTPPDYAVVDLRLTDGYGLMVVEALRKFNPATRIVILTSYGNIASAVTSMKLGAVDYLAKPSDADAIENALLAEKTEGLPPPPEQLMSAERVKWEHISRVYEQCERNISETARRLNMHRRTLQRILAKHAPKEHIEIDDE
ncbi:MAG: ActR/PrrA/RegA family redox response regulator transcription factor [Alphaproteobacteria bacterium]|nr:ActR/PrrA/RegA family redox response regulator transcription factor [Alphaproteobacteria bacterium]